MRRIIYGIIGLFGILLVGALIVPFFIDINDYKPEIEAKAKDALGRDVTVEGKISLHILPIPQVRIDKIMVSNLPGTRSKNLASIRRLEISFELLPVLQKKLNIKSIDLIKPEIYLEKLPNGQPNWQLKVFDQAGKRSSSSSVNFDKVHIHNGRVTYTENGKETALEDIYASLVHQSSPDVYAVEATFDALGQHIKLDTKLGATPNQEFQDISLKAQIDQAILTLKGQMSTSPASFKGNLTAQNITKIKGTKAPSILEGLLRLDAKVEGDLSQILLKGAKFQVGSAQPTGDITILMKDVFEVQGNIQNLPGQGQLIFSVKPSQQGMTGLIKTNVNQTQEFLSWLEIDTNTLPPALLGPLAFSSNFLVGPETHFNNLNLVIQDAQFQGDVSYEPQNPTPILQVDLVSPRVEKVFKLLGVQNSPFSGQAKVQSGIQWDKGSVHLNHLKGQLGQGLTFAGSVAVNHAGPKPQVQANLSLNALRAETFLAAHHEAPPLSNGSIRLISTRPQKVRSTSQIWSTNPLDFGFLNAFDGQFNIHAPQISQKEFVILQPKLSATLQNGRLDIHSLTGSVFGGGFSSAGHVTHTNALKFQMNLKNANLKNLPAVGSNVKIVGGKLNYSSDFSTHGKSISALVQNLNGPVQISATDGVINGFNLRALSEQLGNLRNPASLLGLLTNSMSKGQTRFNSFQGTLNFTQGVGSIQAMNLVGPEAQGQATGTIDLPRYLLNIHANFRLTQIPNLPPFHMVLTGPINNPSRKLDTSALQKYMMENVFKGVVEGLTKGKIDTGNIIGSILGNDKAPQKEQAQKPEQIVKGLVKGLFN